MVRPKAVVCDVNQTLFSMNSIGARLAKAGLDCDVELWFNQVLRDGISLGSAGGFATFKEIGTFYNKAAGQDIDEQKAEEIVVEGFREVEAFPDVEPAFAKLRSKGIQIATMTNGSIAITENFLQRHGLSEYVGVKMEVAEVKVWKPRKEVYQYAAQKLGLKPEEVMLVAVHPWDCNGAKTAGLQAGYIDRKGVPYPPYFTPPPDAHARSFDQLADML